jgi:ABC-type uncharacterized transport system ATPase subunit
LSDARLLCDRVIVMSQGLLVYDGSVAGMTARGGGKVRVRIRTRGRFPGAAPPGGVDGTNLVHQARIGDEYVLVVDGDDEGRIAALVRHLALDDWGILSVEPTLDVLEDAFRQAVLGVAEPGASPRTDTMEEVR